MDDIINVHKGSSVLIFKELIIFIEEETIMSFGSVFNYLFMFAAGVAWCAVIILAVILLIYLVRIARWYIKEQNVPPLFGRKNKKDSEE